MFSDPHQIFLAVLIVLVFIAFAKEWISAELVAIGALMACVFAGILTVQSGEPNNALLVFSDPAPITVACMFILSAALDRTGVIESLGSWFERVAGVSQTRMMVVMIIMVAVLSGFVNNTPVVVVFMPIVISICRNKNYQASKFLIPLSYAAIAGGTMTVIGTSTNLIASGIAARKGIEINMFDITPLGMVFVLVVFVYLLTIGRKLLPERSTLAALIDSESTREFITHAFVKKDSPLIGAHFSENDLKGMKKAKIIEVNRNGIRLRDSLTKIIFQEGDEIVFKGDVRAVMGISNIEGMDVRGNEMLGLEGLRTESAILMEGIIGPDSSLEGRTLKELNFRQRYGVLILAVHRSGRNLKERFEDERLAFGDTLLVQGPSEQMNLLFAQKDFINLSAPKQAILRRKKAPIALLAIALFVIAGALGGNFGIPKIPVVISAMSAAFICLVTRCLDPKEAYEAVEWKVVFMIMGMLGLGMAMEHSGMAESIAKGVMGVTDSPIIMLAAFYLLAAVLTEIISNNAVATLLTPLALIVAINFGVNPTPFVIAVMFGSSASFSTPIGYQTNTFVYGAGGYKFSDFFRAGFPLAIIMWIVAVFLIPVLYPFY